MAIFIFFHFFYVAAKFTTSVCLIFIPVDHFYSLCWSSLSNWRFLHPSNHENMCFIWEHINRAICSLKIFIYENVFNLKFNCYQLVLKCCWYLRGLFQFEMKELRFLGIFQEFWNFLNFWIVLTSEIQIKLTSHKFRFITRSFNS